MFRRILLFQAGLLTAVALVAVLIYASRAEEYRLPPPDGYDPGLYTPFTRAPRPPHPPEIYRPPTTGGPSSTRSTR